MLQKNKPTGGTFSSLVGHLATGQWHEVHHSAKTCVYILWNKFRIMCLDEKLQRLQISDHLQWIWWNLCSREGWKWIQEALTYQCIKHFLKGLTIWYVLYVLLWMKHEYEICTFLFTFYTASQLFWKFTYICAYSIHRKGCFATVLS